MATIRENLKLDSERPDFPGLFVEFDRSCRNTAEASDFAGRIEDVAEWEAALWGLMKWTNAGLEAVQNGRYRFALLKWRPQDISDLGGRKFRLVRLDRIVLTNNPVN